MNEETLNALRSALNDAVHRIIVGMPLHSSRRAEPQQYGKRTSHFFNNCTGLL